MTSAFSSAPVALTIAGSDCSAGAGLQADLKTFSAHGVYGLTAVTCVVAEVPGIVTRIQAARQLTYFSAREKDMEKRCDLEAGMAKLLATRAAWESADANVQIHGGNGFAEEYTASRLLVDARVLSIFEGANEIQAHVVARRLLEI